MLRQQLEVLRRQMQVGAAGVEVVALAKALVEFGEIDGLMYTHTHTPHTRTHTSIHACMHACIHAYIHTYMHTHIHTYIHACMHACMHACIHTCIHTYIQTYIRGFLGGGESPTFFFFLGWSET